MIGAAVAAAAFLTIPALAQNAGGGQSAAATCTSGGLKYAAGEYACVPACHGERRLVRCDARTYGSTTTLGIWTFVSDVCPSAMIEKSPWPNDWTLLPTTAEMTPLPVVVNFSGIAPEIAPKIGSHWN